MSRKEDVVGVFGRAAPTYDQVGPRPFAHFGRQLVERVNLQPSDEVLDVASGRGAVLFPAAERAVRVVGIDLAESMVAALGDEIAVRRLPNAEVQLMDAESLTFDDGTFDVVLCNLSIFFFDVERSLREWFRVLKPGGRLGFTDFAGGDPRWEWHRELLVSLRSDDPRSRAKGPEQPDQRAATEGRLVAAGFDSIAFAEESHDLEFADADEWWRWVWSHGQRGYLEDLDDEQLERHRTSVFARLPDPIVNTWTLLFVFARRP